MKCDYIDLQELKQYNYKCKTTYDVFIKYIGMPGWISNQN